MRTETNITQPPLHLVPRMKQQGYAQPYVQRRRQWLEQKTGCRLTHIGAYSIPSDEMRGNIENPVGAAQIPLGVAGPLLIKGTNAQGVFYVPLATTEGALVRSYERGMAMLTRAGGVTVRVFADTTVVAPWFPFDSVDEAHRFVSRLPDCFESLRKEAESTTRQGKLQKVDAQVVGRAVIVTFHY